MAACKTGPGRLKAGLPAGTAIAHKTGTSGTWGGVTAGTNDVGIVTLPDGKHVAIAAFVADAKASEPACERTIARLARAAWTCFTTVR
jgi:beta-lactamase class A